MAQKNYRDLKVWQRGIDIVVYSYKLAQTLPRTEIFGLSNQIQRTAVAIPSFIANGRLSNALGCLAELGTLIDVCLALNHLEKDQHQAAVRLIEQEEEALKKMLDATKNEFGKIPSPPNRLLFEGEG